MSLYLRPTKTGLRFEYIDDDAETVISIDKTEDEADIVRKLKRVIALAEGTDWMEATMASRLGPQPMAVLSTGEPSVGNGVPGPAAQPTNGWAAAYAQELPDRLQGEVELVQPGEDA